MSRRRRRSQSRALTVTAAPREVVAFGGGLEGAERTSTETMRWKPSRLSADQVINGFGGNGLFAPKTEADFRGRDTVMNDGYAQGIVDINRDNIVGNQFRVNAQPIFTILQNELSRSFDEVWAEEYQQAVEELFNLIADSNACWLDASRVCTFTGLVRLAVAGFVYTGEVLSTAEWIRQNDRPFNTAVQMISPMRLSNPNGAIDTGTLRNGVEKDQWGKPIAYWIRNAFPTEFYQGVDAFNWTRVAAEKPWGRRMVIHIKDTIQPSQTRGIAGLVAVLKQMRMTKKFQEVVLQNAVIDASYAATIESELPSETIAQMMGAGQHDPATNFMGFLHTYMAGLQGFMENANAVKLDGVRIPHLFPGTKLNARTLGTPGGVGTEFETSLLRHTAAGLGISYEELANDFSKTNYSSGKASMLKTKKHMMARKKFVADRYADEIFSLWAEEALSNGALPMPRNYDYRVLYLPSGVQNAVVKEALFNCDWVGAGQGQIDELKETQAALLRINGGLSTHEIEIARQGGDWRKTFKQIAREKKLSGELGIDFSLAAEKSGAASGQQVMKDAKGVTAELESREIDAEDIEPDEPESDPPETGAADVERIIAAVAAVKPPDIHVHFPRKGVEVTRVTKHDENGRIVEFERHEAE